MLDQKRYETQSEAPARPRLVLADDDPVVVAMLSAQLRHAFDLVAIAGDAQSAIARVAEHRPDVVILDVNMPGGGARRATGEIRVGSPYTAIVILSGDETAQDVVDLINDGAVTYLRKGVESATLAAKLRLSIKAHRELGADPAIAPAA